MHPIFTNTVVTAVSSFLGDIFIFTRCLQIVRGDKACIYKSDFFVLSGLFEMC